MLGTFLSAGHINHTGDSRKGIFQSTCAGVIWLPNWNLLREDGPWLPICLILNPNAHVVSVRATWLSLGIQQHHHPLPDPVFMPMNASIRSVGGAAPQGR